MVTDERLVDADYIRSLLAQDLTSLGKDTAKLRQLLTETLHAITEKNTTIVGLERDLHKAKVSRGSGSRLTMAINIIETLNPADQHQLFSAYAYGILASARTTAAQALEYAQVARNLSSNYKHYTEQALKSLEDSDPVSAEEYLQKAHHLPPIPPEPTSKLPEILPPDDDTTYFNKSILEDLFE